MTASRPAPGFGGQPDSAVSNAPRIPFWAGRWYFVITIASVGLLAWVPFVHAAGRLRRRSIAVLAVIYGAATAASVVLLTSTPAATDSQTATDSAMVTSVIGELLLLSVVIAACIQQVSLRRTVYSGMPSQTGSAATPSGIDPALAAALAARARRDAARQLAASDPLIARDLCIGRPDLPHPYDDGGLVDLNSAPAAIIAKVCELAADTADTIVGTRTACGGFLTVDDVFTMADVPVNTWDMIRDRGIVIPH
jgi:hypothetical protein